MWDLGYRLGEPTGPKQRSSPQAPPAKTPLVDEGSGTVGARFSVCCDHMLFGSATKRPRSRYLSFHFGIGNTRSETLLQRLSCVF